MKDLFGCSATLEVNMTEIVILLVKSEGPSGTTLEQYSIKFISMLIIG